MGLSVSFPEGPDEWAWPEADDITMFVENGLGDLLGFDRVFVVNMFHVLIMI